MSYGLWHRRLGRPLRQALSKCFSDIERNSSNKFDVYDACFHAKQTQISFPNSENKALKCSDLIYCDIWGAYCV